MNPELSAEIRLHRVAILGAWRDGFARSLEDSGLTGLKLPTGLLPALFDEILDLFEGGGRDRLSHHDRLAAIGEWVDFPANVSVCLKLLNAGEAAVRGFLIESSPEFGLESELERESILLDLEEAAHILIHREIQGICGQSLRPTTGISWRNGEHRDFRCRHSPETILPFLSPDPDEERVPTLNTRIR